MWTIHIVLVAAALLAPNQRTCAFVVPAARRPRPTTRRRAGEDVGQKASELMTSVSTALETLTEQWVNQGWQVRKRAGRWLPELVKHPGLGETTALTTTQAWLGGDTDDANVKAVTSPSLGDSERQVAVASEFTTFLARRSVDYERRESDGAIIFKDERALAQSVAAFALDLTKELGAAARALARYVDDLEVELAAADEQAVRLRAKVNDAEAQAQSRARVAEAAVEDAARLRTEAKALELSLDEQRRVATALEDSAAQASERIARAEASSETTQDELRAALAKAADLEKNLAQAEVDASKRAEALTLAEQRCKAAEIQANAAKRERDALDAVSAAMERRAIAAETTADETATRLQRILVDTADNEAKLSAALDAVRLDDDLDDDFGAIDDDLDDDLITATEAAAAAAAVTTTENGVLSAAAPLKKKKKKKKGASAELLASLDAPAKAAAADTLRDARDAVRNQLDKPTADKLPSIWKMKKADVVAELESYGRDCSGLLLPELRAWLRVDRLKRSSASPLDEDDDDPGRVNNPGDDAPAVPVQAAESAEDDDDAPPFPEFLDDPPPPPKI